MAKPARKTPAISRKKCGRYSGSKDLPPKENGLLGRRYTFHAPLELAIRGLLYPSMTGVDCKQNYLRYRNLGRRKAPQISPKVFLASFRPPRAGSPVDPATCPWQNA